MPALLIPAEVHRETAASCVRERISVAYPKHSDNGTIA